MTEEHSANNESICDDLQRLTGWEWHFKHEHLRPKLDAFVSTLPTEEVAKRFQHKLVDHAIHFSRSPKLGLGHPSLTFELRPEEANRFIASQTPSLMVEPVQAMPIVPEADKKPRR